MSNLYGNLSEVYQAMYQTFMDYDAEYAFYSHILTKYARQNVLEVGCGTGNLAGRFLQDGFGYCGLDNSEDMLRIAKRNHNAAFLQGDMRHFTLTNHIDAAIITGRTLSYLITNQDVSDAFSAIRNNLTDGGLICFDFIDANRFIPAINTDKTIVHRANFGTRQFSRDSFWRVNLAQSWLFDWKSVYYELDDTQNWLKIGEDNSTIRAFTKNEIELFLTLTGFKIREIIDRPSYAFDTFVMIATKT